MSGPQGKKVFPTMLSRIELFPELWFPMAITRGYFIPYIFYYCVIESYVNIITKLIQKLSKLLWFSKTILEFCQGLDKNIKLGSHLGILKTTD
jgi:hypothetical protein